MKSPLTSVQIAVEVPQRCPILILDEAAVGLVPGHVDDLRGAHQTRRQRVRQIQWLARPHSNPEPSERRIRPFRLGQLPTEDMAHAPRRAPQAGNVDIQIHSVDAFESGEDLIENNPGHSARYIIGRRGQAGSRIA